MRIRSLLLAVGAAALFVSPGAVAGTGSSATTCSGGTVLLTNPVTIGVKPVSGTAGGASNTKIWICYSTTPPGTAGAGGVLLVDVWQCTNASACHPGIYVAAVCYPDGAGMPCYLPTWVNVSPDDVQSDVANGECVAYGGDECVARLPQGAWISLNSNPSRPLVTVGVPGRGVDVHAPLPCLGVRVPCPPA